jgi:3-keto-L-gulonate-6-phosphate decarboxylase
MFLQATVDAPDYEVAERLIAIYNTVPEIDIIEMGAPMVTHYGSIGAQWFMSHVVLGKRIYVDTKLIDFPELELRPFLLAGHRLFSASMIMNDSAFRELSTLCVVNGAQVLVTTMGYPIDHMVERARQLQRIGFNTFIAHGAGVTQDEAFENMIVRIGALSAVSGVKIVAAGGINPDNAGRLRGFPLYGLIVGRGIASAPDPRSAARSILDSVLGERA